MNIKTREIYSEVYSILNLLGDDYIKKLPSNLYQMIEEEKLNEYNPQYDLNLALEDQKIKREAISMIALFHLNYWCDSDNEKSELTSLFKANEDEYKAKLKEQYNLTNHLKKIHKQEEEKIVDEKLVVVKKESFISKILKKIKALFKR